VHAADDRQDDPEEDEEARDAHEMVWEWDATVSAKVA